MAIPPTDIRILFTNYDIITYFLNLASCSEHFISVKHRILTTFNIKKKSILTACMPLRVMVVVFNATFNDISIKSSWSDLLVEEIRVPRENHQPAASHWQTLSHNVVLSTPHLKGFKLTTLVVIGTGCIDSCVNLASIRSRPRRHGRRYGVAAIVR